MITNKQFLLLIDVPIQDQSQQFSIYKIFTLDIPHGNFTACYDVNTPYLRITQDETMTVEISPQQVRICQEANGYFCNIPTLFQPLANPPSCITPMYAKNTAITSNICSLQVRKSSDVSMPSQLAPNAWIVNNSTLSSNHHKYPHLPGRNSSEETHSCIVTTHRACSATSPHFHLPPCYETTSWK